RTRRDIMGTASILLGKGDGTFRAAQNFAVGLGAISLAVGDLNGDGHPDLAVANAGNPNDLAVADTGSVSVFLGKGDGTFQAAHNYPVTTDLSVVVTDFNGDGHLDLALAGGYGVSVLLGQGDGTFQVRHFYHTTVFTQFLAVGDF